MRWHILRILGLGLLLLSLAALLELALLWRKTGTVMLWQKPGAAIFIRQQTLQLVESGIVQYTPAPRDPLDTRTDVRWKMDESIRWWDSLQPKRWEHVGISRGVVYVPQTTYGDVGFPPALRNATSTIRLEYFFIPPLAGALIGQWIGRLSHRKLAKAVKGRCRKCGYDLRATPHRCPECGTAAVESPAPEASSSDPA